LGFQDSLQSEATSKTYSLSQSPSTPVRSDIDGAARPGYDKPKLPWFVATSALVALGLWSLHHRPACQSLDYPSHNKNL
tara:strand:- start:1527 stop:1763 length:237 start_codon:yes stop_codon:yes gene_type:complete